MVRLPGNTCSVVENVSPLVTLCPFRYSPPLSRSWSNWTGGGREGGRGEDGEEEGEEEGGEEGGEGEGTGG